MIAAWIGPAIVAAVISAVVTGMGWFVSERQAVKREADRRRERVVDLQTAILAEIRAGLHRLGDVEALAAEVDQALSIESDFTPFVPRPVPAFVLNALLADLHVLPIAVIDPIVVYYRQMLAIALFVDDLRGDRFAGLSSHRKRSMYRDYIDLLRYADALAGDAVRAICFSLNMRASGPSAPLSGGERGGASELSPSVASSTAGMFKPDEDNGDPHA